MAEERKVQLGFAVDADGVKQGLNEIKQDVREMARDVEQSGQRAGQGLGKIGEGAPEAQRKVDGATRSIISSIERATAAMKAGEKGSAAYFEELGRQRGASASALKPYIDQLKQAEKAQEAARAGLGGMEMSAKATAAAMRQVPAQFQDIIVSLQGGQQPLTVFLQQGSQLSTVFGGAGAAARALGGYVLGMVNPFTLAAAGAAGLAYAYNQGSKEADAYRMALVTTGNAAGTTVGQLQQMAAQIGATSGTQREASQALAVFVSEGKVAADNLQSFTRSAVEFSRATGGAVGDVAKQFTDLAKDPVTATLKLNDSMNYLTESVFRQIKALQDQGRETEAADAAQKAYAETLDRRKDEIIKNLGAIERAWRAIKLEAGYAMDAFLDIGRLNTLETRLAKAKKALDDYNNTLPGKRTTEMVAAVQSRGGEQGIRNEIAGLEELIQNQRKSAEMERQRGDAVKASGWLAQEATKYESELERQRRAVTEATNKYEAALKNDTLTKPQRNELEREYLKIVSGITQVKERQSRSAPRPVVDREALKAAQDLERTYSSLSGLTADYTKTLAVYQKQRADGAITEEQYVAAVEKLIAKQPFAIELTRQEAEARKEATKAAEEADKAISKWYDVREKDAATLDAQLQAMREEIDAIGLTSDAVAELTAKKYDLAAATEEEYAANLKTASAYAGEYKTAYEQAAKDAEARAAKLREKAGLERTKGEKKAAKEAEDAWNKSAQDIERALTDSLFRAFESGKDFGEALADTLKATFNTLVLRPIISAIVQPVSMLINGAVQGGLSALMGGGGGGGAMGLLNGASTLNTAYSAFTGGITSSLGGYIATLGTKFGSTAATSFGMGMQGITLDASLVGTYGGTAYSAGSTVAAAMPYVAIVAAAAAVASNLYDKGWNRQALEGPGKTFMYDSNLSPGMEKYNRKLFSALGMSDKWADILSGTTRMAFLFGRKLKDTGLEATLGSNAEGGSESRQYQFYKGGVFRSDKTEYIQTDPQIEKFLDDSVQAIRASAKSYADALSLPTDALSTYSITLKESFKDLDEAEVKERLAGMLEKFGDGLAEALLGSVGADGAYTPSEFARDGEIASETLARLGGSLMAANNMFDMLGTSAYEASLAGGDMASQLADQFGGLEQMAQAAGAYFQAFYTPLEQLQYGLGQMDKTFADLGLSVPQSREAFRELVEAQDLTTESGRETYAALIAMAPAFDQLADSLYALIGVDPKGIIDTLAKGILSGDLSGAGKQISNMLIGGIHNAMATAAATQIYNIANQYLIQPLLNAIITGQSIEQLLLTGTLEEGVGKMETFADNLATALNDPRIAKGLEAIGKIGPLLANALTPVAQAQSKLPGASGGFTGITMAAPVTYQALPQYSSTDIAEMRYSPRPAVTADMEYTGHTRDTQILYARWKEIERDSEKALKESLRTAGLSPISQQMEDFRAQRIAEYQEGSWEYRRARWQHRDAQYGAMDARERLQAFQNNSSYQTLGNPNIPGSSYEIAKYADHLVDGLLSGIDMSLFSEAEQAAMRLQAYNDVLAQLQESVQTLTSEEEKYLALMQQLPPELQKVLEAEEKRLAGEQRISLQRELDELMLTSAQLRERERDAIHESNLALYDAIQLARTQKALAEELHDLLYKLATPEQRRAMDYDRIAAGLGEAGISITGEQLASASMDQIVAAATAIYQMGETSDETRLALVRAVSGLKDLHDAAKNGQSALNAQAAAARTAAAAANKALGARNNAGSLLDQIDQAMGGKGDRYSRSREAELWAAMQTASYQQQIELSGELTGLILDRYQIEQDAARQQLDYAKQLKDYVAGLQIGNLSPKTLGEKLAEAARQYQDTLGLAQAGDKDAQGRLQGASNAYLELARQYYASGADYTAIFESVTGSLSGLGDSLMTDAERQLSVSNASLDELKKLTGVLEGAYAAAQQDYLAQQSLLSGQLAALQAIEGGAELARDIVQGLPALLAAQLQQQSQVAAAVIETALTKPIEIKPAGEDVPTTIVTPAPIDWSGYQQGNDALVAEIKALREEVKVLREERLTADGQRSELDVAIATEHARRIVDGVGNAVQQGIYQASVSREATYK